MKDNLKYIVKCLLIVLLITICLELTIFNYNHYCSLFYPKSKKASFTIYQDKYEFVPTHDVTRYKYTVEINNINTKVNNLYLDSKESGYITIYLTDEANELYYKAGEVYYNNSIKPSKYLKLHSSGKTDKIKLNIISTEELKLNKVYINTKVPIFFNIVRVLISFFVISVIVLIKHFKPFNDNFKEDKYLYFMCFLFIGFIIGINIFVNSSNYGNMHLDFKEFNQHYQYQLLARSIIKGKFTIDLPVSQKLLSLDNPYDQAYRDAHLKMNEDYYLDYAYSNGKYYSYFGIVPCLFMHLPYYLITHHDLNNAVALSFSCCLYVLSAFFLIYQICNKYFPKVSFKKYFLSCLMMSFLSGLSLVVRIGYFYNIPMTMGAAFAMLGLGFWLKASLNKKINIKYLICGSFFMALVVGCRPQIFLSAFLCIPIFCEQFKNKEIFKPKSLLSIIIPVGIIAIFLMYYNYARFGSIFDFGASYNLTSNDMTKRGFVFGRIFTGLYAFLFELPRINNVFPYIQAYDITTSYIGNTIYEPMVGGFLAINLASIVNLLIFKFKNLFKNKETFYIALLSIIFAIIIVIADIQMAGILPRYICDFGFLLSLSAILIWLNILDNYKGNKEIILKIFVTLIIFGIVYNFFVYFTDGQALIDTTYKKFFYYFYHLFMFGG